MSFDDGMRLFRAGDVSGACEQFHQAVEQDENNHRAWNALGICLSKTGQYDDADTCFENALMLDPGNATYERNRELNNENIRAINQSRHTRNPGEECVPEFFIRHPGIRYALVVFLLLFLMFNAWNLLMWFLKAV